MYKKSKKASMIFPVLFAILTLIVLTTLLLYVNQISKNFDDYPIGERQISIIKTQAKADNAVTYMEMAAPYALNNVIPKVASTAGVKYSECGTYRGIQVLDVSKEGCFPGEQQIQEAFTEEFNSEFNDYLWNYEFQYLPRDNYHLEFNGQDIFAKSVSPLKFSVESISSVMLFEPIEGKAREKVEFTTEEVKIIETTTPSSAKSEISSSSLATVVEKHEERLTRHAEQKGIPPSYIISLVTQESAGDEEAISWTGCVGLGQFCSGTASNDPYIGIFGEVTKCRCGSPGQPSCKESHECTPSNDGRFDPEKSAEAIAVYISRLLNTFNAYSYQEYYAHASYNAGTGLVKTVISQAKEEYNTEDPTWDQFASVLGPEHIIAAYSWIDETEQDEAEAKVREIQGHAPRIVAYRQLYEDEYLNKESTTSLTT